MESFLDLFRLAANACGTTTGIFPSLYDGLKCEGGTTPILDSLSDVIIILGNIMRILIAGSGAVAVVVILGAAIYYITSTGDPARIKRAKDILTNMTIGLLVIMMSYAIITFIASRF